MEFIEDNLVQTMKERALSLNDSSAIVMCTIYELGVREYRDKIQRDPKKLQDAFWEQLEMRLHTGKEFLERFWKEQNCNTTKKRLIISLTRNN